MRNRKFAKQLAVASVVAGVGAAVLLAHAPAMAKPPYPRPSTITRTWQLTFRFHKPQRLIMHSPRHKYAHPKTYWVMRYSVVNKTGRARFFYPRVTLITNTGQIVKAGKGVSHGIFEKVKHLFRNPFMQDQTMIIGRILQGRDNAKHGVVIFAGIDKNVRTLTIYITGLSGDTAVQTDPLTHRPLVLRKTLRLKYRVPGEAIGIPVHLQYEGRTWVMR